MRSIPGMDILVPGAPQEFDSLLEASYASPRPTYFRLSEASNDIAPSPAFGRAALMREGAEATVVAVGPMLKAVMRATEGLDVSVLYYPTVTPFDAEALRQQPARKILLCEPYYRGGLVSEITDALWPDPVLVRSVGVPRKFLTNYGRMAEHDEALGFTPEAIRKDLELLIDVRSRTAH
jgi:transketolase